MQPIFLLLSLLSSGSLAQVQERVADYNEQAEVLEKQVAISCSSNAAGDPVREKIAARIFSDNGSASRLMSEIERSALQTHSALEHAEELVLNRYASVWARKRESAQKHLDAALQKLNSGQSGRKPSSQSESLRAGVRQAFAEYESLRKSSARELVLKDPTASAQFKAELKAFREQKLSDLQALTQAGGRIHNAVQRAIGCHCQMNSLTVCKDTEALKAETERFIAVSNFKKARNAANYGDDKNLTPIGSSSTAK